jgi:uncharacterized phage protein (TIGR01671 family)
MKKLKFRVWDKQCKKYIVGDLFFEQIDNSDFECDCYHDEDGEIHELKYSQRKLDRYHGYDIQQYTGLKDKKGKEIYEGDIVNFILPNNEIEVGASWPYRGKSLVEWSDKSGNYIINFKDCYNTITANLFSCTSIEVIGNIFENPELLK